MNRCSVYIIAEAGVNHNGSLTIARQLVDAAVYAGADAVKFQTFNADRLVARNVEKAEYQKSASGEGESQHTMLRRLELSESDQISLYKYCFKKGIQFLSSPFDLESIDFLHKLGLPIFKIPSGEITNLPYLQKIGSLQKKIILSTGMSYLDEIKEAVNVLRNQGTELDNITVLHCNTDYPTEMSHVNLNAMLSIRNELQLKVGYSDHTLGIEIPIAATAIGAVVIEKHFTLNRGLEGPDHRASLTPAELKNMITAVRNVETAMGHGRKEPSPPEMKNIHITRKYLVAKKKIEAGELFDENNVTAKRIGFKGMSPMQLDKIIGTKAERDFESDEALT